MQQLMQQTVPIATAIATRYETGFGGSERCSTFADANKLQRRVKAAAQHSSNKFASAFALHFTCNVKQRKRRFDKRSLTYWNNGHTRKAEEEETNTNFTNYTNKKKI